VRLLRLRFANGARRGEELIFTGPRVRIGRSRGNTLVLTESDAPLSSGHHAEAILERGAWWIVDTSSTNGTFVNRVAVTRHRLATGDRLAFGDDEFIVAGVRTPAWSWPVVAAIGGGAAAVSVAAIVALSHPARTPSEQIAARAAESVYAIILDAAGRRSVVGTAFAVSADGQLATNGHVADLLRRRGATALAVRGDTFETRRIAGITTHPQWRNGSIRDDVAVLQLDPGRLLLPLPLAPEGAFAQLQRGTSLASFGFPAMSTDPQRPRGRLSRDVVGDVRGDYLEAGLAIAPGTSGSPVFNDAGEVVAIVAGGDFVKNPDGAVVPSGSQVNWAISAERLREMRR
jgi:trypsin-like peptidase/FHA domain-containing protein